MKLQFEINEKMVNLIPEAGPADREALKLDIIKRWETFGEEKALLQSILLGPDGKVLDGRTRLEIMSEIGLLVPESKIERMPYGTTEEDMIMAVKSANMRRNLSLTQKIFMCMRSYLMSKENNEKTTIPGIAKMYGIGSTTLKNALYINKCNEGFSKSLWEGHAVPVINEKNQEILTSSVNTICQYLKRLEEANSVKRNDDHEWKADSNINTQAGKDWYYSQIKLLGNDATYPVKIMMVELANLKFIKEQN